MVDHTTTKKSVYLPVEMAEFIDQLSQAEHRSFTKQVVAIMIAALDYYYPGWDKEENK